MKSLFLLVIGFLFLLSCEKSQKLEKEKANNPNYFPLSVGNYWVYDTYEVDTMGNEALHNSSDTIKITGDTIIDSKHYKIIFGKMFFISSAPKTERFYRDSSGYILDHENNLIFQSTNYNDTIKATPAEIEEMYTWFYTIENFRDNLIVTNETFNDILNQKLTVAKKDPDARILGTMHNLFAPGVGKVVNQSAYMSHLESTKTYYESRLIDYHIE